MAREIPAALSAKATGLFLASRKPLAREREGCESPPAKAGPWQKRDKEARPGGVPDPTFSGDSSQREGAFPPLCPGGGGKGCSPRRPPHPPGFPAHPTRGSRSGAKLRKGGLVCRELERLGALREEAKASETARFAKLTSTPAGSSKPKPEPSRSRRRSRIAPWAGGSRRTAPGAPEETQAGGLERAPQSAAQSRSQRTRPPLLKCGGIADPNRLPCVSWGFPGGLERRTEPWAALEGIGEEGQEPCRARSCHRFRKEAQRGRAGGHRAGGDFPQRPDLGWRRVRSAALQSPAPAGCKPHLPRPQRRPQTRPERGERLERTSGASAPCAACAHSWLPAPFWIFKQIFCTPAFLRFCFALVKASPVRPPSKTFSSRDHPPPPRSPIQAAGRDRRRTSPGALERGRELRPSVPGAGRAQRCQPRPQSGSHSQVGGGCERPPRHLLATLPSAGGGRGMSRRAR